MKKIIICCLIGIFSILFAGCSFFEEEPDMNYIQKHWGETFTCEGVDVTLEKYTITSSALNYFDAGEGKLWVEIHATLINNSTETIYLSDINDSIFYVTDSGEAEYHSMWFSYLDFINSNDSLIPFESITGVFTYKIPENIAPTEGYGYFNETRNIGLEFRMQKNSIYATECYVVKL